MNIEKEVTEPNKSTPDCLLEDVMVRSKHHFETETIFVTEAPIDELVALLRQRKTVGHLNISLSQGTVQKIALTERTKQLNDQEFADVEEILDMVTE